MRRWMYSAVSLFVFVGLGFGSSDDDTGASSEPVPSSDVPPAGAVGSSGSPDADKDTGFLSDATALAAATTCPEGTQRVILRSSDAANKLLPSLPDVVHPEGFSIQSGDVHSLFGAPSESMAVLCRGGDDAWVGVASIFVRANTAEFIVVQGELDETGWSGPIRAHSYDESGRAHETPEFTGALSGGEAVGAWRFFCPAQDMGHSCVGGADVSGELREAKRVGTWWWKEPADMVYGTLKIEYGSAGETPAQAQLTEVRMGERCVWQGTVDHERKLPGWTGGC
ncbi:MAG: hypothetical protein ACI9MC_002752 [Kiritimatiellia bacterium]|jgi:hypothetical protein